MNSAIVFTGTGPILIVTTFDSLEDHALHEKLRDKGISKFIMREVQLEQVEKRYKGRYTNIVDELRAHNDIRVLDYNGNQVMVNFEFPELGKSIEVEDDVVL